MIRDFLVTLIVLYQRIVSPLLSLVIRCRFHPSCSQYGKEALAKHGVLRGVALTAGRLMRCNPWNPGGIDPIP